MSSILARSDFIGVWQRESISIGGGDAFEDSNVLWLQAGDYFADLRWPRSSETGASVMAFAGRTHWQAPRMRFDHEIDLTGGFNEDIGLMSLSNGKLIEQGEITIEKRTIKFEEVWTQLRSVDEKDNQVARRLSQQRSAYIVRVADYALAMQKTDAQFCAGSWLHENGTWRLLCGFGEMESLSSALSGLVSNTMSTDWQVLTAGQA